MKYLLCIILLVLSFGISAQEKEFFEANLEFDFQKIPITIEYQPMPKDSLKLFFGSPSQTDSLFPATKAYIKNDSLLFQLKKINIVFRGKFNQSKDTISGVFKQGTLKYDLAFVKKASPFAYNRPQEPKPPFPYIVEEIEFENPKLPNYKFKGTLTKPKRGKNFPCVILISGSGIQNRDSEIAGHKPFLIIADHLTKCGIAVFRFDDRGYKSTNTKLTDATTFDYITDVEAAIATIKQQPNINPRHIGLIGHSEGGLIAQIVASKDTNVSFIILLAAPGINGKDILATQLTALANADSINQDSIDVMLANQAKIFENPPTKWHKAFFEIDPKDYLPNITQPALILQGDKDLQVVAEANLPAFEMYFGKNKDNNSFRIIRFSEDNHLFQRCITGLPSEYGDIIMTLDPDILHYITEFIREKTKILK